MGQNTVPYQDMIDKELLDPEFKAEYIAALVAQGDPQALLVGLGNIARAKGMTKVSRETGLNRENLDKMLSVEGNSGFLSLFSVLKALDLKLAVLDKHDASSQSDLSPMKLHKPMHPGEFIKQTYIVEFGISVAEAAKHLDVSRSTLNRLINQESSVSPAMAYRLSIVFGMDPESWLRMQSFYDLWEVKNL